MRSSVKSLSMLGAQLIIQPNPPPFPAEPNQATLIVELCVCMCVHMCVCVRMCVCVFSVLGLLT